METVGLQPARCLLWVGADHKQRIGTDRLTVGIDHPYAPVRRKKHVAYADICCLFTAVKSNKFVHH
ncbi:hypothetical protein XAC3615_13150005 [Xanthomonas citri pv. citri]|nr:hypothetical protein XAC3615_13150005 [Xanthomonas citri pv. citri]